MSERRAIYGLVLAGGRSRRMGTDKAALVHPDGRPLAQRAVAMLGKCCERVVVSLRQDQDFPPGIVAGDGVAVVRDAAGGDGGPTVGIIAAMREYPQVDWLVVACDLPRLDEATLGHLLASRQEGERFLAYRSEFDGLPEPLCAFYAAECLGLFVRSEAEGICCPRKMLILQGTRLLEPLVKGALDNANTPEDWREATR